MQTLRYSTNQNLLSNQLKIINMRELDLTITPEVKWKVIPANYIDGQMEYDEHIEITSVKVGKTEIVYDLTWQQLEQLTEQITMQEYGY